MKRPAHRPEKWSKEEVIAAIAKQLKKHPDCLSCSHEWDSYPDKPFSSSPISRVFGSWECARKHFKFNKYRKRNIPREEAIAGIRKQLKKYPDCIRSDYFWNSFSDKPFSSSSVRRLFGDWEAARRHFGNE